MIKRYEVPDRIKADPNGELVAYLDYKEALALIAEMKAVVFTAAAENYASDECPEFHRLCSLVARAEALLA